MAFGIPQWLLILFGAMLATQLLMRLLARSEAAVIGFCVLAVMGAWLVFGDDAGALMVAFIGANLALHHYVIERRWPRTVRRN